MNLSKQAVPTNHFEYFSEYEVKNTEKYVGL